MNGKLPHWPDHESVNTITNVRAYRRSCNVNPHRKARVRRNYQLPKQDKACRKWASDNGGTRTILHHSHHSDIWVGIGMKLIDDKARSASWFGVHTQAICICTVPAYAEVSHANQPRAHQPQRVEGLCIVDVGDCIVKNPKL